MCPTNQYLLGIKIWSEQQKIRNHQVAIWWLRLMEFVWVFFLLHLVSDVAGVLPVHGQYTIQNVSRIFLGMAHCSRMTQASTFPTLTSWALILIMAKVTAVKAPCFVNGWHDWIFSLHDMIFRLLSLGFLLEWKVMRVCWERFGGSRMFLHPSLTVRYGQPKWDYEWEANPVRDVPELQPLSQTGCGHLAELRTVWSWSCML